MNDPSHARKLEKEIIEARTSGTDYDSTNKDPLLLILYRLNHQDRTLEEIESKLGRMGVTITEHIAKDSIIQDSLDEMVSMWKGSKLVGKILSWAIGILAALGAGIAAIKKGVF